MFLGIDPGKTGGYAILSTEGKIILFDKFTSWRNISTHSICEEVTFACIEKIAAMPFDRKRLKSFATLMKNYGGWLAILESAETSHELISPQKWHTKILGHFPRGESKKRSLEFVRRKYPYLNLKDSQHGISDAVCLALFALITYKKSKI